MKKINDKVESILKHDRASRNSDTRLLIVYMQKSGMELTDKQIEVFKNLPAMETITRARRNLQEQGKYEADEAVQEARYIKMQQHQDEYSDPNKYLNRLGYALAEED
jgi:hypothetical protein